MLSVSKGKRARKLQLI